MDFRDTIKQLLDIPGMELDSKTGVVFCEYRDTLISTDYCVRVRVAPSIQVSAQEVTRIEMDILVDSPIGILEMTPSQARIYASLHTQAADTAYWAIQYVGEASWNKEEYLDFLAETNFVIPDEEIKVEWFRSGTDLNKPSNAVRLIHIPSRMYTRSVKHKIKHKNYEEALRLLKRKVSRHVRSYGEDWKENQVI